MKVVERAGLARELHPASQEVRKGWGQREETCPSVHKGQLLAVVEG